MKHLKYILILALSSAMGTLQAQDLKELMKENRENREANYAKWGPTSKLEIGIRAGRNDSSSSSQGNP